MRWQDPRFSLPLWILHQQRPSVWFQLLLPSPEFSVHARRFLSGNRHRNLLHVYILRLRPQEWSHMCFQYAACQMCRQSQLSCNTFPYLPWFCSFFINVKKPIFRKSRRRAIIPWYHFYSLIPNDISLIVRNNRRSRHSLAFDCSCIYLQFVSATPKPSSIRFPSFPLSLTGNFSVKILLMYFLFPSVFYIIVYPNNNRFIRICKVARS